MPETTTSPHAGADPFAAGTAGANAVGVAAGVAVGGVEGLEPGFELGARAVLAAVVERRRVADRAEAELLGFVVELMGLGPVVGDVEAAVVWMTGDGVQWLPPMAVPVAGAGTPQVAEQAVEELGAALGVSYRAALSLVGDAIELCFRLPRLWALVQGGSLQAWKARRVARVTPTLSAQTVGFVDRQLAVAGRRNLVPANLDPVVHEALLRCDPEVAGGREEAALAGRGVSFDFGLSTATCATASMTATLDTLDAIDLDDTISDIAAAMGRLGDASGPGVRRAHALGMLADPQRTLDVFGPVGDGQLPDSQAEGRGGRGTDDTDDTEAAAATEGAASDGVGSSFAGTGLAGGRGGSGAVADRLHAIRTTLYLHIDIEDLRAATAEGAAAHAAAAAAAAAAEASAGAGAGTCGRVEKLGPATLRLLADWLARTESVTIRPVLDVGRRDQVDGHDPTGAMREPVILRDGHCIFPGCGVDARSCDQDHIVAYVPLDQGGPPGQTSVAALGSLCRRHHRLKTFTGWRYHRLPDGDYQWTSPAGDVYLAHPDRKR